MSLCTYVHVDDLAIALGPADNGRDYDEGVLGDEIPYASLLFAIALGRGCEVELEGVDGCDQ